MRRQFIRFPILRSQTVAEVGLPAYSSQYIRRYANKFCVRNSEGYVYIIADRDKLAGGC